MVRKAVRTYSQILADFERADEEDARIRAFYEPSGAQAAVRPSADSDAQKKRPVSAARKHRYAHNLDWNDDISAIVNIDKHDSGARAGTLAAAFAADRKGSASRALTAALHCAMETASRLQHLPPAPTTNHTSRLAMRLLRAAQTPLPVPASPPGSTVATPRTDTTPSTTDPHQPLDPAAATAPSLRSPGSRSPSRPSSSQNVGRPDAATADPLQASFTFVPSGSVNLELEEQQQLAIASGTLLNSSARMLYYGSAKPRLRRAQSRSTVVSGGSSRPFSAPSQHSAPSQPAPLPSSTSPYAPPRLKLPQGRASLMATWAPSPVSTRSRPGSACPASTRPNSARPNSARPNSARPNSARPNSARPNSARPTSARLSITSFAATSPRSLTVTTPRRGDTSTSLHVMSPPASARQTAPRSSTPIIAAGVSRDAVVAIPVETARSLGMNPRQLHQVQPKHGPSNGVVVRDPIGPQLVPNRRMTLLRPFSAPPGGTPDACDGTDDGGLESPGTAAQQQLQQQLWPPSPSWQPIRGSSPPHRQEQQQVGRSVSPERQAWGSSPPHRRGVQRDESIQSAVSPRTVTSVPSCGSVAAAAAAAAVNTAVSSSVTLARRRHAALVGARKALWSQIADAAGVMPYEVQDPDGGPVEGPNASGGGVVLRSGGATATPASSSSYLEAYLAQQAAAGSNSGASSRVQSRSSSPERFVHQHQHMSHHPHHRSNRIWASDISFRFEPSATHLLSSASVGSASGSALAAAAAAAAAAAGEADTAGEMSTSQASNQGSEQGGTASSGGRRGGGETHLTPFRMGHQGSVLRVLSVIKRRPRTGSGVGDEEGGDPSTTTPSGNKRVQWEATVWSPRHNRVQQPRILVAATAGGTETAPELERGPASGTEDHSSGGDVGDGTQQVDLCRSPRCPAPTWPSPNGNESGNGGGLVSPISSVSVQGSQSAEHHGHHHHNHQHQQYNRHRQHRQQQHSLRKRQPAGRLQTDLELEDEDADSDLPSLEVSTTAGVLDRAAQSPKGDVEGRNSSGGEVGPLPGFTDPEFYCLTAYVDRTEDVQGWLFNVYLTDIVPGNPIARRVCIATCTTADENKQLLVPPPPAARLRSASATAALNSSLSTSGSKLALVPQAMRPLPSSPLISPAEVLPWISRPEQLFGHWLRLEAFAIAPMADKVVDAMTFMGRLDSDLPPPPQPRVGKLHVVDIRPAAAAAAHAAAAAAATVTAGHGGIHRATAAAAAAAGGSSIRSRPASASSVSTLAEALGQQHLSHAGNAAQVQARLAADVALPGRQRPASALVRGSGSWS